MMIFKLLPKLIQATASIILISITSRNLPTNQFVQLSVLTLVFSSIGSFDFGINSRLINKSFSNYVVSDGDFSDSLSIIFTSELKANLKLCLKALLIQWVLLICAIFLSLGKTFDLKFLSIASVSLISISGYWLGSRLGSYFVVLGINQLQLNLYAIGAISQTVLTYILKNSPILFSASILILCLPNLIIAIYVLKKIWKFGVVGATEPVADKIGKFDLMSLRAQTAQILQFATNFAVPTLLIQVLSQEIFASVSIQYRIFVAASSSIGALTASQWRNFFLSMNGNDLTSHEIFKSVSKLVKPYFQACIIVALLISICGPAVWKFVGGDYEKPTLLVWIGWSLAVLLYQLYDFMKLLLTTRNSYFFMSKLELIRLLHLLLFLSIFSSHSPGSVSLILAASFLVPTLFGLISFRLFNSEKIRY